MAKLVVIDRSGAQAEAPAKIGRSVMLALRDAGFDDILALCGGACACATCHVIIDPEWSDRAGVPSANEADMLDALEHRAPTSRLSCQIIMTEAMNGLSLAIAPEE